MLGLLYIYIKKKNIYIYAYPAILYEEPIDIYIVELLSYMYTFIWPLHLYPRTETELQYNTIAVPFITPATNDTPLT